MGTLYTFIDEFGKKPIVVLNRNYTVEQLREKLSSPGSQHNPERIEEVLTKGIYLPEGKTLKIKAHGEGNITTQCVIRSWWFGKGYKIKVNSDGSFNYTKSAITKIKAIMRKVTNSILKKSLA